MNHDYSILFKNREKNLDFSWESLYDDSLTYPENILNLFNNSVFLPNDFYRVIATYALIPSALCNRIPYLFAYGVSGSGKSTIGKLIARMHGIVITGSNTTYAAMRNLLRDRKTATIFVESDDPKFPGGYGKTIEANSFIVWEDINSRTLRDNPCTYNMLKCSYDRSCDTILISSETKGKNEQFRAFSPMVFGSIEPLHALEQFKELRRRLIVIPTKRVEHLSDARKTELGITNDDYVDKIIDIDNYNWKGFSLKFKEFWNLEQADIFLTIRSALTRNIKGLTSSQRAISLDLIAVGISCRIWNDEAEAVKDLKQCFEWIENDLKVTQSPLKDLIGHLVKQEETNAINGDYNPSLDANTLRSYAQNWYEKGWLLDKPHSKDIVVIMGEHGYKLNKGKWLKQ